MIQSDGPTSSVQKRKKDRRTYRKELVEEMTSIGVNVTRQTVTTTLRTEGLNRHRAKKTPCLENKHLYVRIQFAIEMLSKKENYLVRILR